MREKTKQLIEEEEKLKVMSLLDDVCFEDWDKENKPYTLVTPKKYESTKDEIKKSVMFPLNIHNTKDIDLFLSCSKEELSKRVKDLIEFVQASHDELIIYSITKYISKMYNFPMKVLDKFSTATKNKTKAKNEKKSDLWNKFDWVSEGKKFIQKTPVFYDNSRLWWMWDEKAFCWKELDDVDILNKYREFDFNIDIAQINNKKCVLNALQLVGRQNMPKPAKVKYIQFKDKVFNIKNHKIHDVENRFFFTNPIPWEIGETSNTPVMDKLFEEWVGEENVQILYEIIAYCCLRDYPIQVLFCFLGHGRNGKSQFQKLLAKFLGLENMCSTELDQLSNSRFESFKLFKKLACSMGETNFGMLNNTSILKKLTGGDLISYEKKNKDPFDEYNYAKIIINSNSLPSSEDTSEGYYRRWIIIDFPNQFKEGKDIFKTIPDSEYVSLAKKVCEVLPKLMENGEFTNQGTIEERKQKYIEASNPLTLFLDNYCVRDGEGYVRYGSLYKAFVQFLSKKKKRIVSRKEFNNVLNLEGFEVRRTTKFIDEMNSERDVWVEGLSFIKDETLIMDDISKLEYKSIKKSPFE